MTIRLCIICVLFSVTSVFSQTDAQIGSVYINRAEQSYLDDNLNEAVSNFDEGMKYIKEINDSRIARIGTLISYKLNDLSKADVFAKRYFDLNPEEDTEEFKEMLELRVAIMDDLKARAIAERKALEAKIAKEKEERRIDSLSTIWSNNAKEYLISADSIGTFDQYNFAVFKLSNKYGLMSDIGEIIMEADTYSSFLTHDGYYIFMNDEKKPTRLFCYNSQLKSGHELPNVSQFNANAYDFGKVMLPRENGLLVTYPSNANDILLYDLNKKTFVTNDGKKELLKELKKNDIIERYNSELQIRLNKFWYDVGTSIGGGFYPLYDKKSLKGFLSTSNGRFFDTAYYEHFGPYCNGKFQIIENGNVLWMDAEGIKFDAIDNANGDYNGSNQVIKIDDNNFRIISTDQGKKVFVKGKNRLINLEDYLKEFAK